MFLPRVNLPDEPIAIQLVLRDLAILRMLPYSIMFYSESTP
jgi:hypothetical protein